MCNIQSIGIQQELRFAFVGSEGYGSPVAIFEHKYEGQVVDKQQPDYLNSIKIARDFFNEGLIKKT